MEAAPDEIAVAERTDATRTRSRNAATLGGSLQDHHLLVERRLARSSTSSSRNVLRALPHTMVLR
ncbi:MAG: hypothetical protein BGO98_19170 [Myxococcales bacterium 68-20]|nr:MAG: hypothetical protein BGO98_19170 [Myxococcales bacterium 68-20]